MQSQISTKSSSLSAFLRWLPVFAVQGEQYTRSEQLAQQPNRTAAAREAAAWQKLQELNTDLLEATIALQVKSSLGIFLTTLHREIRYEYRFQRPTATGEWQLTQSWNPLAY